MKTLATTFVAVCAICAAAACESSGGNQYDGVSRFAASPGPYYGPGSPPREPTSPERSLPGRSEPQGNI